MATAKLYNLARMTTATTGTGTITLGSAATGFISFATAGVSDGESITYAIEDGNNREIGRGTYTASGTTLTRSVLKSTNAGSAINLSGSAQVFITDAAEDHIAGPSASVDSELVLFSGTGGATLKRASTTGILKGASGVLSAASAGTDYVAPSGALGTPSSGTLTNCTGLPVAGISASTSTALGVGSIELGHASDTTISRVSAGVAAIEGSNIVVSGGALGTPASGTLTNCTGLPVAGITASTSTALGVGSIELGHASDTTLARVSAGVVSVEGVQLMSAGKHTIWIPAGAMTARTTNGAAAGTAEMTTNKQMYKTLDFDTSTQEFAQFAIHMPKGWNESTVTFQPVWSHASTTTNFGVVWALQGLALSDDDAGDAAFGTEQTSTDTGGTTNDIYIGPESSAITIGGTPAENDYVIFQIKRNVSDGSDTLAIDARLHGIKLLYTTNAATDA